MHQSSKYAGVRKLFTVLRPDVVEASGGWQQ